MSVRAPLRAAREGATLEVTATALVEPARRARATRSRTRDERLGIGATVSIPMIGLLLCVAGTRTEPLLSQTIQLAPPASLAGPFRYIGFRMTLGEVVVALVLLVAGYLLAVRQSAHVPARTVIWAVVAFNLIVLLGPPLFSTDVFSYQAYARMLTIYHTNPYSHGPDAIQLDPLYNYIGSRWIATPSVYGPLFTFLSGAFASSSVWFSEFAFKLIAVAASGGTLYLIWQSARLRGVDPGRAIAIFGLNPLVTLYGVGGGHNDLLMLLLTSGGVYALLSRRQAASGSLMAAGAAIKLTGGLVLPFALLSEVRSDDDRPRRALVLGAAAVTAVVAGASLAVFGTGILQMPHTLQTVQDMGKWQSVPGFFFSVAHVPVPAVVRAAVDLGLAASVLWLLHRVWAGRMDWIDAAAWATFAVLISAWYLLPWYACWMMPLVALTRSERLWRAAAVMTLIGGGIMVAGCFPSISQVLAF